MKTRHVIFVFFFMTLITPFLLLSVSPAGAADGDFLWAGSMGGSVDDQGNSVFVDAGGNVYTTGFFEGTVDFDPGPDTMNLSSPNSTGIFISKLDSGGNLVWARDIGGNTYDDAGFGIAVDSAGNVYTTGYFQGNNVDFDPGPGTYPLSSQGSSDIFISKLDRNGDFVWAKRMGGNFYDYGYGIFIDPAGNVYTTGYFRGTVDFDPGDGTYFLSSQQVTTDDIFISKLDSSGNFIWARQIGVSVGVITDADVGLGISLYSAGSVYTTGYFRGTVDFDPGPGTLNLTSANSSYDIFVSRLDSGGNLVWAKRMGGPTQDVGNSISLDGAGNVYTTGAFHDTADFDPAAAATYELTSDGPAADIFVSKLDRNGNFVWARRIGGPLSDVGYGISVNSSGSVLTTGFFDGTVDFDPGPGTYELTTPVDHAIFISKLNSGGSFIWAKGMGGNVFLGDSGNSVFADSNGNVYTTGYFRDTVDFDPGNAVYNLTSNGGADIFVSKLEGPDRFTWPMFLPAITGNAQP